MCLAVPAQIKSTKGLGAEVEIGGVSRTISVVLTPDATVGDFVYVHTDYAISIVDEAEAQQSLRLLRELAAIWPVEELYLTTGGLSLP